MIRRAVVFAGVTQYGITYRAMDTVTIKLPEALKIRLKVIAAKRKSSTSEIVRKAPEEYLAWGPDASEGAVLDLTRDLVGSLDGPKDLCMATKYAKGYGR